MTKYAKTDAKVGLDQKRSTEELSFPRINQ